MQETETVVEDGVERVLRRGTRGGLGGRVRLSRLARVGDELDRLLRERVGGVSSARRPKRRAGRTM